MLFYCRLDEKFFFRSFDRGAVTSFAGFFSSITRHTHAPRCFYRKFRSLNDSRGFNVIGRRASLASPGRTRRIGAFICSITFKSRSEESFRKEKTHRRVKLSEINWTHIFTLWKTMLGLLRTNSQMKRNQLDEKRFCATTSSSSRVPSPSRGWGTLSLRRRLMRSRRDSVRMAALASRLRGELIGCQYT